MNTAIFLKIVENPHIHSKWLNTLSLMENVGARKIKKCEDPIFVNEIILKHAAEESRHAYYLKKQLSKIENADCPTYEMKYLIAPKYSYFYLQVLDVEVCRYLKNTFDYTGNKLKYAAYLLVTYAIEVRADELYPSYQFALEKHHSKVNVKSIIAEEKNHLAEMESQLKVFSPNWEQMIAFAVSTEKQLFENWMLEVEREVMR